MPYQKPILQSKHYPAFLNAMADQSGKTVVITGTTSGTGKVAAQALASKGARVIMLNRPSPRAQKAQANMAQAFADADVCTVDCDLQRFASVQAAADNLQSLCAEQGIDVLINNAGIMAMPDEATVDGFDTQMQTNHLSHFLLTREVFPLLQKAAELRGEARIVNHSSVARFGVRSLEAKYLERNGGNLGGNGSSMVFGGGRWQRYSQTKLANAAFTAALHQRISAKRLPVKSLVAHPGFANTELQVTTSHAGGMAGWTSKFARFVSQTEEDGTLGILCCAVSPDAQSGQFYGPGPRGFKGPATPFPLERQYNNPHTMEMLWAKSCEAIGKDFVI